MKLIGQFDSPFVRRVGIALHLYDLPFEHVPWSVWRDAEQLAPYNPLRRVPTLVLDDGVALVESGAILDHLDDLVGPERALLPRGGAARRDELRLCALATGAGDKAVSLFYEALLREHPSQVWIDRCRAQILDTFDAIERELARAPRRGLAHADVAIACVVRFADEAHPGLLDHARVPAVTALAARCEALPAFVAIQQPFTVTVGRAPGR